MRLIKLFRLHRLLRAIRKEKCTHFYKVGEGIWFLETLIQDEKVIELLRKEIYGKTKER